MKTLAVFKVFFLRADGAEPMVAGQITREIDTATQGDYEAVSDADGVAFAAPLISRDDVLNVYQFQGCMIRQDLFAGIQTRLEQKGVMD